MPTMFFQYEPIIIGSLGAEEDAEGGSVAEPALQYRPRHPERSVFYQLFDGHFDSYVRLYEERFEGRSGPLRPVVVRSVEEFLSCGRLQGGFARIRCTKCRKEPLLAFSCRTRNFCSSCQAKRSVLFPAPLLPDSLPIPSDFLLPLEIEMPIKNFTEQINLQRALEGELARTISSLPEISFARVHVVLPKDSLFDEKKGGQGKSPHRAQERSGTVPIRHCRD
jgi:hypothetical protein